MDKYDYIIMGSSGLIGSSFVKKYSSLGKNVLSINSENFSEYCNKNICSKYFINANGNSYKFKANNNPDWDYEKSVESLIDSVKYFKSDKYIFFSSIDVYSDKTDPNNNNETACLNPKDVETYGSHKLIAEEYLKENHNDFLIFRLGSVVSINSKKGALYDIAMNKTFINPCSKLSFIDLKNIHVAFETIIKLKKSNEIFNLTGSGNVSLKSLIDKFDISLSKLTSDAAKNKPVINISTDKILDFCKLDNASKIAENYFIELNKVREINHEH